MKKANTNGAAYYQSMRTKYMNYAREASAAGDRVLCEHNLQCAEHYCRLINAKNYKPQNSQPNRDGGSAEQYSSGGSAHTYGQQSNGTSSRVVAAASHRPPHKPSEPELVVGDTEHKSAVHREPQKSEHEELRKKPDDVDSGPPKTAKPKSAAAPRKVKTESEDEASQPQPKRKVVRRSVKPKLSQSEETVS
ncbi:MAG: DUF4167 domain-containing protein [Holosporales bacterium]|jgi:hypothetical protein|nr:DUF4167 domain-containing protein [Holosporales bacterium]